MSGEESEQKLSDILDYKKGYRDGYSDGFKDAMLSVQKQMRDDIKEGAMPWIRWP